MTRFMQCLFIYMENVTVGGLVLITSLIGAVTALTTLLKRRCTSLALLTFSDATFTSAIGFIIVARGLDWIAAQWTLAVFCGALCHAQHSSLTMVAHACGTRGLKLASLIALSWTVPTVWISVLVALPQSCNLNQSLVVSLVKKIYGLVQHHNRTRRLFDELKPIWFEEKYDDTENLYDDQIMHEQRNINASLTRDKGFNNASTTTMYFPDMNMTLIPPIWKQHEEPSVCLVVLLFISYVMPILLISTLNVQHSHIKVHMSIPTRYNEDQVTRCPIPRPRSAPPCVTPRPLVQTPRSQISATGKCGLIRALVVFSAVIFAPGLATALLQVQSQTISKIIQLSTISLHVVFKTTVNTRLLSAPRVYPR